MKENGLENSMENILGVQKQAYLEQPVPGLAQRRQRLQGFISPIKLIGAIPPFSDKFRNFLLNQIKK
jgi:hypothetical protein